jgi:hypothetical protein
MSSIIQRYHASMPRHPGPPHSISTRPKRKAPPYPFILEALAPLHPEVRPMFSGYAVYVSDKIVCMLRDSVKAPADNGIWLVFADAFDASDDPQALRHEFPSIRPIQLLGGKIGHWRVLPAEAPNFEAESMHFCDLLLAHHPRLGRIPESRKPRVAK